MSLTSPQTTSRQVTQPSRIRIRRVVRGSGADATTLNANTRPSTFVGAWDVGGRNGWTTGQLERRLYEEGTGTLRLPNAAGSDGVRHLDRLACLSDPGYLPGDEWFEVYEDGDLIGCWTPTGRQSKRRSELQITGEDATTLLKRTRENQAGFWRAAPREAIEHYGRAWQVICGDEFDIPGQYPYSTTGYFNADDSYTGSYSWSDPAYPGALHIKVQSWTTATGGGGRGISGIHTGHTIGGPGGDPYMPWRLEMEVVPLSMTTYDDIQLAGDHVNMMVRWDGSTICSASLPDDSAVVSLPWVKTKFQLGAPLQMAMEGRDRWVWFYVNGNLLGCLPQAFDANHARNLTGGTGFHFYSANTEYLLNRFSFRVAPRLLVDNDVGDRHLPGSPTPGGLQGEYLDCSDMFMRVPGAQYVMTNPAAPVATTRIDPQVNFASANPPAWRPTAGGDEHFAVRWTGSVYLDLANQDIALRITGDDEAKLWVARTRGAEEVATSSSMTPAPTVWMRAGSVASSAPSGNGGPLHDNPSGWYPILIEYKQVGGAGGCKLEWSNSGAVGTWTAIPTAKLSPYGTYNDLVRNESHYDALKNVAESFGYQWTCQPKSLESGQFPGRIIPKVRVGRDTERVLDEPDATDIQADIDLDSRADAIQADASGLADFAGAAQLTGEAIDFPATYNHLLIGQDYESLSDISDQALFAQRLSTLLALRSAVWEEVAARPAGRRELADSWPLTGVLAEFAWTVGDGLRLNFPSVGVVDATPRQILGLTREFVPDGMRPPSASFRPRPRSVKALMREVRRAALLPQRNYQRQLVQVQGSLGADTYAGSHGGFGAVDQYSRITLPANPDDLVSWNLVVLWLSNPGAYWGLTVNGVGITTGGPISHTGTYDLTAFAASIRGGYNIANLSTWGIQTAGSYLIQLQATVRV